MHSIVTMCRVLGVSAAAITHSKRPPSARAGADAELSVLIGKIHHTRAPLMGRRASTPSGGHGMHVGRKRVARLMKAARLRGASRRQWITPLCASPGTTAPD